jgi:hypothetical protein
MTNRETPSKLIHLQAQLLLDVFRNYLTTGEREYKVPAELRNTQYAGTDVHIDYIIDALRRKRMLNHPIHIKKGNEEEYYTLEISTYDDRTSIILEKIYDKGLTIDKLISILSS